MKKFLSLLIIVFAFITQNCSSVDYLTISVPEEGGVNFTKFSDENEKIVGPIVTKNASTGSLMWYSQPFIAISKDGKKLAYSALANNYFNMFLKNISGGKSIVQKTFNKNVYDESFSPDGKKIIYSAGTGIDLNIYMIDAEGGAAIQQLVSSSANELGAVFSIDGSRIYYSKDEGGRYYIWSMDLSTSLQTQYTEGFNPNPLGNGKSILVTRNSKDGLNRGEIWLIDLEKGSETSILSNPNIGFSSPQISPDGTTIICVGATSKTKILLSNLDIYSVKLDGSNLKQLTFHGGNDVSPVWAPDGKSVFFLSQRGNSKGAFNIWQMNNTNY